MRISKKYYSREENLFYVVIEEGFLSKTKKFKTFRTFAKFLNNDLKGANLYEYDFDGIDLKKYNIKNVSICSSVLKKQGLLNTKFYEKNVNKCNSLLEQNYSYSSEIIEIRDMPIMTYDDLHEKNELCISYISDIHLNHKIKESFPDYTSEQEIIDFIKKIIEKIQFDFLNTNSAVLLIGGDVSFTYSISEIFYRELRNALPYQKIYVVIGNHELWDKSIIKEANKHNCICQVKSFHF